MSDSELTPDEAAKLPRRMKEPITKSLPAYLKDPANYEKIQRALLDTLASGHSHAEILDWHKCRGCQRRVQNHKMMMEHLGFQSPAQYYSWRRIMDIMTKDLKNPLK